MGTPSNGGQLLFASSTVLMPAMASSLQVTSPSLRVGGRNSTRFSASLVVTMIGERTTYVEEPSAQDPGYRAELVRTAFWFVAEQDTIRPWMWADTLGSKVQPRADHRVPWEALRWSDPRTLRVDPRGVGTAG